MSTIYLRANYPSGLTNTQIDANFTNLNNDKLEASWTGNTTLVTLGTITTGTWNAGAVTSSGAIQGTQLKSTVATGTAPFTVNSTTVVTNLNADLLDGQTGTYYTTANNLTGTIPSAVLGTSSVFLGTTSIPLNRASGALTLNGVTVTQVSNTTTGTTPIDLVTGTMADNDYFRIRVGGTAADAGFAEIATADNGTEPIYVRQYSGSFASVVRTATLLDESGNTSFPGNVTVGGNFIINGTTTTVNSTTVTIDDPIFTLGGDSAPTSDDNKDRGIEFRWHNGTAAKVGFFGFDDSTGKFTFIPDATNTSEVFSGTKGTLDANIEWNDVLNRQNFWSSFTDGTNTATPDSLTDTFTFAAGGGLTVAVDATNDKVTYSHTDTSSVATVTAAARTFVNSITFDTYGHVTAVGTTTEESYTLDGSGTTNSVNLELLAAGTVKDSINVVGAGTTTVAWDEATQKMTISSTDTVNLADQSTSASSFYPTFASATLGSQTLYTSSTKLNYQPSTGSLNATNFNSLSDISKKTNLVKITNATETINQIDGFEFDWIENGNKSSGVIAQYLEKILPFLVETNAEGTKSVNYAGLTAYLIESVKELSARVEQLEKNK